MIRGGRTIIVFLFFAFFPFTPLSASTPITWQADTVEAVLEAGSLPSREAEVILKGNVCIESGDRMVRADYVRYLPGSKEAWLQGNVRFSLPFGEIKTDELSYNFNTGNGFTGPADFSSPPWFGRAERIEISGAKEVSLYDGYLTTCDIVPSHYRIAFKDASLKKDGGIKIESATFRVGWLPVFYLPRYFQRKDESPFGLNFTPTLSSRDGVQAVTVTFYSTPESSYYCDFDLRGDRGIGVGPGLESEESGTDRVKTYFIHDQDVDEDRYRIEAWHRSEFLRENGEDDFLLELHKFSDEDFLEDYFWRESVKDVERDSFLYYSMNREDYALSLFTNAELDNEHNMTWHLPELAFVSPFRKSGSFYWKEDLLLSNLSKEFSAEREETQRAHYTQSISNFYPLAGGILRPFLTGGFTYYSQNIKGEEEGRVFSQAGCDLGWKFGHTFERADGTTLTHYLEPRITFLNQWADESPDEFFSYDEVDEIQSDNIISFQLLNRLNYNKDGKSSEKMRVDLKADYSLQEGKFGDLHGLFVLDPQGRLAFRNESEFDLDRGVWNTSSTSCTWRNDRFNFGLQHNYQQDYTETIVPSISFPVGNKWKVDAYATYNLEDDRFEGREISLWRDLHCWEVRFGVYEDQEETEVYCEFSLKAFPMHSLKVKSHFD